MTVAHNPQDLNLLRAKGRKHSSQPPETGPNGIDWPRTRTSNHESFLVSSRAAMTVLLAVGPALAETTNLEAANGPIPGDVTLYAKELACQQAIPTPGYFSSLNGAEISDATRSGMFPCATFTGSFDGPNSVFRLPQHRRLPRHLLHQQSPPGRALHRRRRIPDQGRPQHGRPLHRQADATTGKQVWRTYLDNFNVSGRGSATRTSTS